jgi:hypothetical protein
MKEKNTTKIMRNERLNLSLYQLYLHYFPAIIISTIPVINVYFLISSFIRNDQISYEKIISGIELPIVFLFISIILFIIKYKNLEFKTLETEEENNEFNNALELTIKELKWKQIRKENNCFLGVSKSSLVGFGEEVTILKKDRKIFINSINNPNSILSNFSFGGNRKNINTFKKNLKASV